MATRKITDLTQATTASDADLMVIQDTSKTKKITFSTLLTSIKSKLGVGTAANLNTTSKEIVGAINEINTNLYTQNEYHPTSANNDYFSVENSVAVDCGNFLFIGVNVGILKSVTANNNSSIFSFATSGISFPYNVKAGEATIIQGGNKVGSVGIAAVGNTSSIQIINNISLNANAAVVGQIILPKALYRK